MVKVSLLNDLHCVQIHVYSLIRCDLMKKIVSALGLHPAEKASAPMEHGVKPLQIGAIHFLYFMPPYKTNTDEPLSDLKRHKWPFNILFFFLSFLLLLKQQSVKSAWEEQSWTHIDLISASFI